MGKGKRYSVLTIIHQLGVNVAHATQDKVEAEANVHVCVRMLVLLLFLQSEHHTERCRIIDTRIGWDQEAGCYRQKARLQSQTRQDDIQTCSDSLVVQHSEHTQAKTHGRASTHTHIHMSTHKVHPTSLPHSMHTHIHTQSMYSSPPSQHLLTLKQTSANKTRSTSPPN